MGDELKIAAIITEYKERGFLEEAYASVINQTRKPDIIAILKKEPQEKDKNFIGQLFYYEEDHYGKMLYKVINSIDADVYSFLDDDDKWLPKKIEYVEKVFQDPDVVFYRNRNSDKTFINSDKTFKIPVGNLSSQSIRKMPNLYKLTYFSTIVDIAIYLIALENTDKKMIVDDETKEVLTYYRRHQGNYSITDQFRKERDSILIQMPNWFTGKAKEYAEFIKKRDYGN